MDLLQQRRTSKARIDNLAIFFSLLWKMGATNHDAPMSIDSLRRIPLACSTANHRAKHLRAGVPRAFCGGLYGSETALEISTYRLIHVHEQAEELANEVVLPLHGPCNFRTIA